MTAKKKSAAAVSGSQKENNFNVLTLIEGKRQIVGVCGVDEGAAREKFILVCPGAQIFNITAA